MPLHNIESKSVERTGMSRPAQCQLQRQRRLIPVAHLTLDGSTRPMPLKSFLRTLIVAEIGLGIIRPLYEL